MSRCCGEIDEYSCAYCGNTGYGVCDSCGGCPSCCTCVDGVDAEELGYDPEAKWARPIDLYWPADVPLPNPLLPGSELPDA